MGCSSVPVDLLNPGQVFACLGFVEAADILLGEARGGFDWTGDGSVQFRVEAASEDPVARVLRFIDEAKVTAWAPAGSSLDTGEKGEPDTGHRDSYEYPFPKPGSPATLPARLYDAAGKVIVIDYWGDQAQQTRRDNVKFWGGSRGKSGAAFTLDALDLVRGRVQDHTDDPFALTAEQSGSFRFDWRRDYVPIDAGFSPNDHRSELTMQGYPVVELLAAIGLTHARPLRHDKLRYSYGVAGIAGPVLYDPIFLRAALGARRPPLSAMPFRRFSMRLAWPGQENQARCIVDVIEENALS